MYPIIVIALLSFPIISQAHPILAPRANITCATGVHIIVARGTTEPPGAGLTGLVAQDILSAIPGSDVSPVDYPASFDATPSLTQGVSDLQSQANFYASNCPQSKMVLMGYSQGAEVVGDSISGGGNGTPFGTVSPPATPLDGNVQSKIIAVIQFGDPNRLTSQGTQADNQKCIVDAPQRRTGANEAKFEEYAARTQEWCHKGDPVCCSTGTEFLDHLRYFTGDTGSRAAEFVKARL